MQSADHYEQLSVEAADAAEQYIVNNEWETGTYMIQRAAVYAQLAIAAASAAR
jgi:hypothetical protein